MNDKKYLYMLYKEEKLHSGVYRLLANKENTPKLKKVFYDLADVEKKHTILWGVLVDTKKAKISLLKIKLHTLLFDMIRKVFGTSMAIKFLEYKEDGYHKKLDNISFVFKTKREREIISKIKKDERIRETPLKNSINEYSDVIENIRNITIGMNDGLVEVLAATAGLAAAIKLPILVLVGGVIVALSGTFSMVGAAYLSTEYEKDVRIVQKKSYASPNKSSFYTGISYIIGSIFPLIPFIFGIGGAYGILISVVLTMIVLSTTAALIAIITNVSIKRRVIKTLLISLGATSVTIMLGYFARFVLNSLV